MTFQREKHRNLPFKGSRCRPEVAEGVEGVEGVVSALALEKNFFTDIILTPVNQLNQ
jgi:hypothetical protein